MSNQWRRVAAALANPDARRVYAELVAAETAAPSVAKRDRAIRTLATAGLIEPDASGTPRTNPTVFADLLAEAAEPRKEGVDRFIVDGRIAQYPARPTERLEVLRWAVGTAVTPDEVLTESEVNERLAELTDDFATLRRYLVDARLLERTPSGTSYARTAPTDRA
ncbi:DUF2087 domain-containing protein [Cryobacterium sp. BB307]|uniref:DUF2087 domain-containing protein n=1 Tax=Cryobacterium sp. BB307 TaxID=2716317 RepID=UPI0014467D13|nr:DUF2087 domain-containing protein [Cryobacterium sp. BB307]